MELKPLPIGVDDFKKIRLNNYYFVDKTLLIKEIVDKKGEVNLFTRPRRFGKTLNLSMLRYYFENSQEDCAGLFQGLDILAAGEKYSKLQGQFPVISLSLKSAKQPDYELAYSCLKEDIAREYKRHIIILENEMLSMEKEKYLRIAREEGEPEDYVTSLRFLSECLFQHYEKKVIILIDEYDVPLENAYFEGFYKAMTDLIRSLFESALKSNPALEFSVITGCMRITKESIFTGLNNLEVISVLNKNYGEFFGFTKTEVKDILRYYDRLSRIDVITEWYDGYLFGNSEVYNPWSIMNYVKELVADSNAFTRPYWANTSSNQVVRALVERADSVMKQELEMLIDGGSLEKPVHEDITYEDVYKSEENLWNFLFFTGYLRKVKEEFKGDTVYITLKIPNLEVRYIYKNTILSWTQEQIEKRDLAPLYQAMIEGEAELAEEMISEVLAESISFYDSSGRGNFYHGYLLGLMKNIKKYAVLSNRESGDGRPDIVIKSPRTRDGVMILELKVADSYKELESKCEEALRQIDEKQYAKPFQMEGYEKIMKYGIAFYRKECMVKCSWLIKK